MYRILVIEDDKALSEGLCFDLKEEGYSVEAASCALDAFSVLAKREFDLALLDGNLPDISGFELCPKIRELHQIPVVFLTARDLEEDQIAGFDCGADDYITKPFNMQLLRRRIRAVLMRSGKGQRKDMYEEGYLSVDFERLQVTREGKTTVLTPTEYRLLKLFAGSGGRVLTRQILLERLYDEEGNYVDEHALEVGINRLRRKIEGKDRKYIKTVYGMGYLWTGGSGDEI